MLRWRTPGARPWGGVLRDRRRSTPAKAARVESARQAGRQIPSRSSLWLPAGADVSFPAGHLLVLQRRLGEESRAEQGSWSSRSIAARPSTAGPARWPAGALARPEQGRIVKRSEHDDLCDDLRERMNQPEGQAVYGCGNRRSSGNTRT